MDYYERKKRAYQLFLKLERQGASKTAIVHQLEQQFGFGDVQVENWIKRLEKWENDRLEKRKAIQRAATEEAHSVLKAASGSD